MKPLTFLGDSRARLRAFPYKVCRTIGFELFDVQQGLDPSNWKSMPGIGAGVCELRVRDPAGAFRVIYLARLPECVLVLHAFQKKTRATAKHDIDLAVQRLKEWMQ